MNSLKTGLQLGIRTGVAALTSVAIAQQLSHPNPLPVLASAVIVTDVDPAQTRFFALRRLLGTIVGAALGILFGSGGPVGVGIGVTVAMVLGYTLGSAPAAKLAGYVCGVVILARGGDSMGAALQRLLETAIGIGAAVAISYVPPVWPVRPDISEGSTSQ
jgi:uncharacterized membrane protein YgaE (UPF0421/DUF939 family)